MKDLVQKAVTDGYEEARKRVPLFTDSLFLWVHENKTQEAFTQFLAAFVDKAVGSTVEMLIGKIKDVEEYGKGNEGAAR